MITVLVKLNFVSRNAVNTPVYNTIHFYNLAYHHVLYDNHRIIRTLMRLNPFSIIRLKVRNFIYHFTNSLQVL